MLYFKILKIHSGDLLAFTRIGSVNTRICPVNARVSIALTSLNCSGLRTVLVVTQHWQSGPQRCGWLESLNLPGPYSPLNTGSLSRLSRRGRRAAAAVEPVEFFKKAKVVNLKPCRGRLCMGSQARCHGMRQSYDLGLAASLTLSCRPGPPGVNAFFLALATRRRCPVRAIDLGPQQLGLETATIWNARHQDWRSFPAMLLQWCLLWTHINPLEVRTHINPLEVYQNRSSVLNTTSDRWWISDHGHVNDWYKRNLNPKI